MKQSIYKIVSVSEAARAYARGENVYFLSGEAIAQWGIAPCSVRKARRRVMTTMKYFGPPMLRQAKD